MLGNLLYPVFPLRQYNKLYKEDNAIIIETVYNTYILDDKNLKGNTLGERRLRIAKDYRYPLSKPLFSLEEVMRSKAKKFIDSSGFITSYTKSKFYKITCKEILSVDKIGGYTNILDIKGIGLIAYESFKDISDPKYCLIVKLGIGYLVYGFTDEKVKDFRRKL